MIKIKSGLVLGKSGYKTKSDFTLENGKLTIPNMDDLQAVVDMIKDDKDYQLLEKLIGHPIKSLTSGLSFDFNGPMFGKPW